MKHEFTAFHGSVETGGVLEVGWEEFETFRGTREGGEVSELDGVIGVTYGAMDDVTCCKETLNEGACNVARGTGDGTGEGWCGDFDGVQRDAESGSGHFCN